MRQGLYTHIYICCKFLQVYTSFDSERFCNWKFSRRICVRLREKKMCKDCRRDTCMSTKTFRLTRTQQSNTLRWRNGGCIIQGQLSMTAQRAACETPNVHPSYWGSVHLGPNFTWTESSPAEMSIPFDRYLIALQLCSFKFLNNETFKMVSCRKFCETTNLGISGILGKLEVTHDGWWLAL